MTDQAPPHAASSGPLAGFGAVLRWGLGLTLRRHALLLYLALAVGVGFLVSLIVRRGGKVTEVPELAKWLWRSLDYGVLAFPLPILALLLIGPAYTREVRARTLVYHLVRPVARHTVFLARFAAGWIPAVLVAGVLFHAAVEFSGVGLPAGVYVSLFLVGALGTLSLGAVYYTLSVVFERGVMVGLLYTFLIEVMLASLPGTMQILTLRYHLRSLYHGWVDGPFTEISPGVAERVAGGSHNQEQRSDQIFSPVPFESPEQAIAVLLVVSAALLAFGCWRVARRDFPLKD
jgi:ABC-type transport system involved in multi-copper enzyme maturation permease subunit